MKWISKLLKTLPVIAIGYIAIAALFNYVLFPLSPPNFSSYFQPGDSFSSDLQGDRQTIVGIENGWVILETEVYPHAEGPPAHIHYGFDETFEVAKGELTYIVDGNKQVLTEGGKLTVQAGIAHKFYNETDAQAIMAGDQATMPVEFAGYLSQLYGFLESSPDNQHPPRILLQLSMWYPHFDSTLAEGPPPGVMKVIFWLLQPTARLIGYKNYYEKFSPGQDSSET